MSSQLIFLIPKAYIEKLTLDRLFLQIKVTVKSSEKLTVKFEVSEHG